MEELQNKMYVIQFFNKNTLPPITALKQDDKGVQVDLQDLGYETSGKSEQDREECSSTGRCLGDRLCMSVEWALISNVDQLSAWGVNKDDRHAVFYLEMWLLSVS